MKVKPEEKGESSCTGVSVSVNHAGQNMSEHSSDDFEQVAAGLRQQGSSSFKSFLSARAECPL